MGGCTDFVQNAQITEILQGYHPTQVDDEGRIVFAAEFLKNAGGDLYADGPAFGATAPTQITTHVSTQAGFTLELNTFFKLSACKLFSFNYTSPSLDLLDLMGLPEPTTDGVGNQVQTRLGDGCVLAPAMVFHPDDLSTVEVGQGLFLSLDFNFNGAGFPGSDPCCTEIEVTIDIPIPGFPTYVPVENGAFSSGGITVLFPRGRVPDGQGGSASPSPTASSYTVNLTATAPPDIDPGCASPIVAVRPVTVTMPVISADLVPLPGASAPGDGPVWNPDTGGATLNAQVSEVTDPGPPGDAWHYAQFQVSFPGPITTSPAEVTFTLLDASRNPYPRNDVYVSSGTIAYPTSSLMQLNSSAVLSESFSASPCVRPTRRRGCGC